MGSYHMSSVHHTWSHASRLIRAYEAYVAAPKSFTDTTLKELQSRGDTKEQEKLLADSKKPLGNAPRIPSDGGLPQDSVRPALPSEGGMPAELLRKFVFPPDAVNL